MKRDEADMVATGPLTRIDDELVVRIDGAQAFSAETIKVLKSVCDKAEDHDSPVVVFVHVSGAPEGAWTRDLNIALVTKWERMLRRLERLAVTTVAVASGDCGGAALDVLLTTDLRIARPGVRLLIPADGEATWPGMAIFRLSQQAGIGRVRRAVLFGVPIGASEALALGLIDELADDPESTTTTAKRIGVYSGKETAIRRQLMFDAGRTSFEDALGPHLAACDRALRRTAAGTAP